VPYRVAVGFELEYGRRQGRVVRRGGGAPPHCPKPPVAERVARLERLQAVRGKPLVVAARAAVDQRPDLKRWRGW
jgi:hypothetical protein